MSNNKRINEFLNYWSELYRSNPRSEFTSEHFYSKLIFFDITQEDQNVDLTAQPSRVNSNYRKAPNMIDTSIHPNSTFNNLIQLYSDSTETDCFLDPKNKYFCFIVSRKSDAKIADQHIKIYIPLDSNHIEYGATLLFNYLQASNISHKSKIGKKIRFDDIVIRVTNAYDARRILEFINSSPYIQEGLIKPNPFAFQENGIALAVDGHLSYNEVLSKILKSYMDYKRTTNTLNNVNAEDFYSYVRMIYTDQFITHRNEQLRNILQWEQKEERNYREVIALIFKIHTPNFQLYDLIDHYQKCETIDLLLPENIKYTKELLIELLQTLIITQKTGAFSNVKGYLMSNNEKLLPRSNNLRNIIVNSNFRKTIFLYLREKNITFEEFVSDVLREYNVDFSDQLRAPNL